MAAEEKPFQYDYTKLQNPTLSVEQLDKIAADVFNPNGVTGWFAVAWAAVKLLAALGYIWARYKLVDSQQLIEKQRYELARTGKNQGEVDQEPPPITKPPAPPASP
jgi:hypothetical protein